MPIRWEILHPEKRVHVVGEDIVTLQHVETYLDAIVTAGAMSYGKLFDATKVVPQYDDHDILMLGARFSAYRSTLECGPLVFVVNGDSVLETIKKYINLAAAERPVAVFRTIGKARLWLDARLQST